MKLPKPLLIGKAAIDSVVLTTSVTLSNIPTPNGTGLVDKITSKFNLNKIDVQKVSDVDRAAHQQEHD